MGVVIGKGGDMIKKIQSDTGARVQFQQGREDGPGDRKCLLSGKPQAVEQARQRIQELIDSVMVNFDISLENSFLLPRLSMFNRRNCLYGVKIICTNF